MVFSSPNPFVKPPFRTVHVAGGHVFEFAVTSSGQYNKQIATFVGLPVDIVNVVRATAGVMASSDNFAHFLGIHVVLADQFVNYLYLAW